MKTLKGTPYFINFTNDIIGKITKSNKPVFNRKNYILIDKNAQEGSPGYVATITSCKNILSNKPILADVNDIDSFNEGDVVLIDKNGEVVFLYEIQSQHNCIMATERCNHHCIMCPQPPIVEEADKTDFNLRLISLFDKDSKVVGITGGEPTLIGDKLFVLIKQMEKKMPKASISILSNGVKFANKDYAMNLALSHHNDLQIDIPIFSDIAEEHNKIVGAKTFYKTVQGLYNLALFHQQIGLRIVMHKLTYKRLPQLADFIYHNFPFVSQVAFMQMETTGLASTNLNDLWIDPYDYNKQLREAVLLLCERGITTYIYNAQLCVLPEDIREFALQSISEWKDVYLPECDGCKLKNQCGGLFESNKLYHSKHIHKINITSCNLGYRNS